MLKKLLKYDLKSVFKYWWIAALASLGLSVVGGFCISILSAEKEPPTAIMVLIVFALIFTVIGLVAFSILSYILIYVRFYKNFFTDEGYLTFTLPVKRSQLLNSKLITCVLTMFCTITVIFIDIAIMIAIGVGDSFYAEIQSVMSQLYAVLLETPVSAWIYICCWIVMFVVFLVLSSVFSTLFIFACITFAAVITKKAKVVAAIGIYYVANGFISGFVQILYMFGIGAVVDWISALEDKIIPPVITLIIACIILLVALICWLIYTLEYFMLDRKLNLS